MRWIRGGIHVAGDGRKYTLLVSSVHRALRLPVTTFPLVQLQPQMGGRRYCIVMLSAVGDAVHVLPVVNAIKRADPHLAHHLGAAARTGGARGGHPAVDEIVRSTGRADGAPSPDVRDTFRGRQFDIVLALQDYLKAGILTAIAPRP